MPTDLPPDYKPKPRPDPANPDAAPDAAGTDAPKGGVTGNPGVAAPPGPDVVVPGVIEPGAGLGPAVPSPAGGPVPGSSF